MTRRDEPVPLRDAIASVGRELGLPDPDALNTLIAAWPDIVGPAVAQHAHVRSVRDGVCTITVDAPAWATQLRYVESEVVARAAQRCGPGVVTALRVVVGDPRSRVE
jgi:predicted nucleic acid-binding Zn ribbon protein